MTSASIIHMSQSFMASTSTGFLIRAQTCEAGFSTTRHARPPEAHRLRNLAEVRRPPAGQRGADEHYPLSLKFGLTLSEDGVIYLSNSNLTQLSLLSKISTILFFTESDFWHLAAFSGITRCLPFLFSGGPRFESVLRSARQTSRKTREPYAKLDKCGLDRSVGN